MKHARPFPRRLVRFVSLSVSFTLLLSVLTNIPVGSASSKKPVTRGSDRAQDEKRKKADAVPPKSGPPEARLPNLDEERQRHRVAPRAPEPVESTSRSRRKPIEARQGRRVADSTAPVHPIPVRRNGRISQNHSFERMAPAISVARSHHARMRAPVPQGPSGLVRYWKYDENSGSTAADSSGNGDRKNWSGA
jgi:hypothetical protein